MKYYMVEGIILDAGKMDDAIMKEHMAYTQKAMDSGMELDLITIDLQDAYTSLKEILGEAGGDRVVSGRGTL